MTEERVFDTGRLRFAFRDADGEEFASFRIDPTDPGLPGRAGEVAEFFGSLRESSDIGELEKAVEEKLCYLLGYDAREELFGRCRAVTVSADGELFAAAVLDFIAEALAPELERRGRRLREHVAKYTAKYAGGRDLACGELL